MSNDKPTPLASNEQSMLERARPCVKESRDRWDLMLLSQRKAPRSNAPHMLPDHYIGVLEEHVQILDRLLSQIDAYLSGEPASAHETKPDEGFQARVYDWMKKCFMRPDSMLPVQRSFRFTEEALELAQAAGTSREEVTQLVDYVYSRPRGAVGQEIGGVMVTLSGLATSLGLSMEYAGDAELRRCEENTEKIRAKDLSKPERSPLPGSSEKASGEPT